MPLVYFKNKLFKIWWKPEWDIQLLVVALKFQKEQGCIDWAKARAKRIFKRVAPKLTDSIFLIGFPIYFMFVMIQKGTERENFILRHVFLNVTEIGMYIVKNYFTDMFQKTFGRNIIINPVINGQINKEKFFFY